MIRNYGKGEEKTSESDEQVARRECPSYAMRSRNGSKV
jgi:hypothetical protein